MKLSVANEININTAAGIIKSGGLVAFPTETVYGLGADGLNAVASAKIFEAKKRPSFNPLILHICDTQMLEKITIVENELVLKIIEAFWPGPLTIILPKKEIVPDIVTSGLPTVAVRMPQNQIALKLIKMSETPIAAPSANKFGSLSPTTALHVAKQLNDDVDMILDGGKTSVGVESTIIEVVGSDIFLLRHGGIPVEELEKNTGKKIFIKETDPENPNSPGQLASHYSPQITTRFFSDDDLDKFKNKKIGALLFRQNKYGIDFFTSRYLSPEGNLQEAAANLFRYLHELENEKPDIILVEPVPLSGLGVAIMDRLNKAVHKYL